MPSVCMFPGQGSQFVGMGEQLFEHYPEELRIADDILGYSLRTLCLEDPSQQLSNTEFTQPALFFVNILHYLKFREFKSSADIATRPLDKSLIFTGHSLGEYCALFSAGAFDLATGLKLVQKRGQLMAQAPKGAMAAILDIDQKEVRRVLTEGAMESIDIANVNSRTQTIVSGLYDDILMAETHFVNAGARYVPLNVSAAFHSRYMEDTAKVYADFINTFELKPLLSPVISNVTAQPYPQKEYSDYLVKQIDHSVLWYETVSSLIHSNIDEFMEIGPGLVLTKMAAAIKKEPAQTRSSNLSFPTTTEEFISDGNNRQLKTKNIYLMFAGQGSQYYGMGAELYRTNEVFKKTMNMCDEIVNRHIGYSIVDEIYQLDASQMFNHIIVSHPAIVSFGYSLFKTLQAEVTDFVGVVGHSLGEYVAAVAADVISIDDCLAMVCTQAKLLQRQCPTGHLLSVIADSNFFELNAGMFSDTQLAAINSDKNRMFSGSLNSVQLLKEKLDALNIVSVVLPVDYAFHSKEVDCIKEAFMEAFRALKVATPSKRFISGASAAAKDQYRLEDFWHAIREPIKFNKLLLTNFDVDIDVLIDLSATGSLSGFIRESSQSNISHTFAVNQFGRNTTTLQSALALIN